MVSIYEIFHVFITFYLKNKWWDHMFSKPKIHVAKISS